MTNELERGGVGPVEVTKEQGYEIERRVRETLQGEGFAVSYQQLDRWAVGVVPYSRDPQTPPPPLSEEVKGQVEAIFAAVLARK